MTKLMRDAQLVILIDELHHADEAFRGSLAHLIKTLADTGADFPVLVLAGTRTQPSQLVAANKGIDRLIREVPVAPLAREESEFIITNGLEKLGLSIEGDVLQRVVVAAAGAPSLLHAISLEAAKKALSRDSRRVYDEDINYGIKRVVFGYHGRLTERYLQATNSIGQKRYRSQILRACAEYELEYVTMDMLVAKVSENRGEEVHRANLQEPLRQLKSTECGEILSDVRKADGTGRQLNVTVFTDPQMKSYVRFLNGLEDDDLFDLQDDDGDSNGEDFPY